MPVDERERVDEGTGRVGRVGPHDPLGQGSCLFQVAPFHLQPGHGGEQAHVLGTGVQTPGGGVPGLPVALGPPFHQRHQQERLAVPAALGQVTAKLHAGIIEISPPEAELAAPESGQMGVGLQSLGTGVGIQRRPLVADFQVRVSQVGEHLRAGPGRGGHPAKRLEPSAQMGPPSVVLQHRPAFRLLSLAQEAGPQIEEDVLVARIQAQDLAEVPFRGGVPSLLQIQFSQVEKSGRLFGPELKHQLQLPAGVRVTAHAEVRNPETQSQFPTVETPVQGLPEIADSFRVVAKGGLTDAGQIVDDRRRVGSLQQLFKVGQRPQVVLVQFHLLHGAVGRRSRLAPEPARKTERHRDTGEKPGGSETRRCAHVFRLRSKEPARQKLIYCESVESVHIRAISRRIEQLCTSKSGKSGLDSPLSRYDHFYRADSKEHRQEAGYHDRPSRPGSRAAGIRRGRAIRQVS